METRDYLKQIVEELHTSVMATVDTDGRLAITLMKGTDTMNTLAISLKGCAREIGPEKLPVLFRKNSYMNEIYPTEESLRALTVLLQRDDIIFFEESLRNG